MPARGGLPGRARGGVCRGMLSVRWLDAEAGVRRSNRRRCESEDTAERREGEWGEKEVL